MASPLHRGPSGSAGPVGESYAHSLPNVRPGETTVGWAGVSSHDQRTCGRLACPTTPGPTTRSVIPAEDDPPPETGQGQGLRFRLDRVACRARETAPGLHGHRRLRASPRPDDLALDQDATRPDARR